MSTCKWCNNHGFFLSVDNDGLCKKCAFIIRSEAQSKMRVIKNSDELIEKTKNIDTAISNAEVMIKYLSELLRYEIKGIEVFNRPTKEILQTTYSVIDEKILKLVSQEYEATKEKIEQAKTKNSKDKLADKFKSYTEKPLKHLNQREIKNQSLADKILILQNNLFSLNEVQV